MFFRVAWQCDVVSLAHTIHHGVRQADRTGPLLITSYDRSRSHFPHPNGQYYHNPQPAPEC